MLDPKALPLRLSFSQTLPTHQLAWDSVSSGALKTCARYYQYSIVWGFVPDEEVIHLTFGLIYHSCLEFFHKKRAEGLDVHQSLLLTTQKALVLTWNFEKQRPWFSTIPTKNRLTLIRSVVWYLLEFGENDTLETVILKDGTPAVELALNFDTGRKSTATHEEYSLVYHIDRLVKWNSYKWINDYKTTKYQLNDIYFAQFTPNNQVSGYSFAGKIVYDEEIRGFIVDATQIGVTFNRYRRQEIERNEFQLKEWFRDMWHWWDLAERYAQENYWPQNDKNCIRYGRPCEYLGICSAKNESVRERLLKSGAFVQRVWDPLKQREAA